MSKRTIGIFAGSLRKEAFSMKSARAAAALLEQEFEPHIIELGGLQLFNQDIDDSGAPPREWIEFRKTVKKLDGVLFITPEYNRSYPAVLKNSLDIASRPYGENCWEGKPAGVISITPGRYGAFGANHHLRQVLVFLNMPVLQQPEMYIGEAGELFDDSGKLTDERALKLFKNYLAAYTRWVHTICSAR
jgi:chromate reductase